jgi:hypothetical protein
MKAFITGDSHIAMLKRGLTALVEENNAALQHHSILIGRLGGGHIFPTPFFLEKDGYAEITNPIFRKNMKRLPPEGVAPDWIGWSGLLHAARVWGHDFRERSPWPINTGHTISENTLLRGIKDDVRYQLDLLDILQKSVRVFVIESPRPFRHHPAIAMNGANKVMHIYHIYRDWVLKELENRSVPAVGIDPEWVDSEGFMDPIFRSSLPRDNHHGNSDFGRLMLLRILDFLDGNKAVCI